MPAPETHPEEPRKRAVRRVVESRERTGQRKVAPARAGGRIGIGPGPLRNLADAADVVVRTCAGRRSTPSGVGQQTAVA